MSTIDVANIEIPIEKINIDFKCKIHLHEVKKDLKRMKTNKTIGRDDFPIEM